MPRASAPNESALGSEHDCAGDGQHRLVARGVAAAETPDAGRGTQIRSSESAELVRRWVQPALRVGDETRRETKRVAPETVDRTGRTDGGRKISARSRPRTAAAEALVPGGLTGEGCAAAIRSKSNPTRTPRERKKR